MNTWTAYRLFLTPLSPIHIGTGFDYEPTNYVIEGEALHEFDATTLADVLSASDRAALARIVEGHPDDTMLRKVQQFFYERRVQLAAVAHHRIPVPPGVATLYQQRVGQIAQHEGRGRRIMHQLAISRTASVPLTTLPLLPGSSQKGAIRTALLDLVNQGAPPLPHEHEGLHEFQGRLFRYAEPREGGGMRMKLERDPMRLIQLTDATWQANAGLPATEIAFAVNREKASGRGQTDQPRATRGDSGPPQMLECIPPWRYRSFVGRLIIQSVDHLPHTSQLPAQDLRFTMRQIAQACNRFYRPILEGELALLRDRNCLDPEWGQVIELVINGDLLQQQAAFLLRVGRHSGAESVTLNGVRRIRILRGRGQGPSVAPEATTIWLAARERDQTSGLMPFGWMLVEFCPIEQESPAVWAPLKQICDRRLAPARKWADHVRALEGEWRRKGLVSSEHATRRPTLASSRPSCPWVDDKLAELCSKPGIKPDDALRGPGLAEAVRAIEDPTLRAQAVADIVARWKEKGWWDHATGGATKKAKAIYDDLLNEPMSSP